MQKLSTMKQKQRESWTPDSTQRKIISIEEGCHLVLAPPGCGKTQILAERICHAHVMGVAYDDMLCLTFTNRAARGMRERVAENVDDESATDVFVGNVHRYCSRFLFENSLVPAESSVIDDDTVVGILSMYLQEDEERVLDDSGRRREYSEIMFMAHLMFELRNGIPKPLRLHPECLSKDDIAVLETICGVREQPFTSESVLDIYDHTDFFLDFVRSEGFDIALRQQAVRLLERMRYAHGYDAYRRQNNLLDFEDLLQLTYVAMRDGRSHKRYPWIQVDEVQDLNALQLAIIDELSTLEFAPSGGKIVSGTGTLMYLGDEMQAIFSFMGAKLHILGELKKRCEGHIYHLGINHRSPKYLVDLLNLYAVKVLKADADLLPAPTDGSPMRGGELQIVSSDNIESEYVDVANMATRLFHDHPDETIAIIVNANKDADTISKLLLEKRQSHFKVSGTDLFSTPEVKLLMAHLSALSNDNNFIAWSRLLRGTKVFGTNSGARQFVHRLKARAITPADFFDYKDTTYIQAFVQAYDERALVVFDTETTGLNVFEDDVIQIAAQRIRDGMVVGKFCVHIATEREIPRMLGDVVNPIIEERKRNVIVTHEQGLRMFLDFVGDDVLVAHNADYDYHIMDWNVRRYLRGVKWQTRCPKCFDSLKIIRLLRPDLRAFKLKSLLGDLKLEGRNSHLADDDVHATVQLLAYCRRQGAKVVESQREFLGRKSTQEHIRMIRQNYGDMFVEARERLYDRPAKSAESAIVSEMKHFYRMARANGWMSETAKMKYVFSFIDNDILTTQRNLSLKEQLDNHITELSTLKESDLCGSSAIDERMFVSTIHKAKGLEFDNVVVFDMVDSRMPSYFNRNDFKGLAEDARKLYVAMSRARKRLVITCCKTRKVSGNVIPQRITRFLEPVSHLFEKD